MAKVYEECQRGRTYDLTRLRIVHQPGDPFPRLLGMPVLTSEWLPCPKVAWRIAQSARRYKERWQDPYPDNRDLDQTEFEGMMQDVAWMRRWLRRVPYLRDIHTQLWDILRTCRWAERSWAVHYDYQHGRYTVGEIMRQVRETP